jgi:hypothetical protein
MKVDGMSVNAWANGPNTPGYVCTDARLTNRGVSRWPWQGRALTTVDQDYGQAGWDIGFNYSGLSDLATQLSSLSRPDWVPGSGTIGRGEIRRLAIHAHGNAGTLHVNGTPGPSLTARTVPSMHPDLHRIGLMTPDDAAYPAVILLVGCVAAQGREGTALLTALSRVWPNRKVVGFATLGYVAGGEMLRRGAGCTEAGMRDTTALHAGEADDLAGRYWHNRTDWPWASETSPRAKVALNGGITLGAQW